MKITNLILHNALNPHNKPLNQLVLKRKPPTMLDKGERIYYSRIRTNRTSCDE